MKRLPWIALAVVIIAGCAGGGTNVGGTGTTGTTATTGTTGVTGATGTTGRTGVSVNLPDVPGLIDTYYLTAQGRAAGDLTAILEVARYRNDLGDTAEEALLTPLNILLTGTNVQSTPINSDVATPQPSYPASKTFNYLDLNFSQFLRETDTGSLQALDGINVALTGQEVTAFRGRVTALQLFLNDSMFPIDGGGNVSFDNATFVAQNRNPETGTVRGFLSDYVSFDISAVPNKPQMPAFGTDTGLEFAPQSPFASRVYFSGDSTAISDKDPRSANYQTNGINGVFVFLTPSSFVEGFFRPVDPTTQLRTYELKQRDPQSFPDPRLITALKGIYREYPTVMGNFSDFNFITIPRSGDGRKQQIVCWTGQSSVTNMWFGEVDFLGGANPIFRIYPIANLYPATVANEMTGILPKASLRDANGQAVSTGVANWWRNVRYGQFQFAGTRPAGSPVSGEFSAFRRP